MTTFEYIILDSDHGSPERNTIIVEQTEKFVCALKPKASLSGRF